MKIKRELLAQFATQVEGDLSLMIRAAESAREAAIHVESKAEDQYDTRGIEASYLAGAQSKRASELQELFILFKSIDPRTFGPTDPISATAVIELDSDGKRSTCLMMPKGGGVSTVFQGQTIQVVTPQSPLGTALLGRKEGEFVEIDVQKSLREYEIVAVS